VALAAAEARVFITGRRSSKLLETVQEMRSFLIPVDDCHLVECDITQPGDIARACSTVARRCESLYGLINNAALPQIAKPHPLQEYTVEEWEHLMRTNVTGHWCLTREIFPHMSKGGEVRILFITSEAGWASTTGFGPYNISKCALNSLSASMAAEYGASYPQVDIQINALDPGEAKSEMNQGSAVSPYSVVSMAMILLSHPKGGPNGAFFHRDGRHLSFAYSRQFGKTLA
jgi:NAD(P)-dependent dehydrogenase (short-subunit alcohol dehydrogenase family)